MKARVLFIAALAAACVALVLAQNPQPSPACRADVNRNGIVDQADLDAVRLSYGKKVGEPGFNPAVDFDGNGVIDLLDLTFVSRQYGLRCEPTVNRSPEITSQPVTDARHSALYTYQVVASDPDQDTLTYALTTAPPGMVIDGTGAITWLAAGQPGDRDVTVVVSDGKGGSAIQQYVLHVIDASPPSVAVYAPVRVSAGQPLTVTVAADDNVAVASVGLEVNGLVLTPKTAPPFVWDVDNPAQTPPGTSYRLRATVTDTSGNTASAEATAAVDVRSDTESPRVALSAPSQVQPGTLLNVAAAASDDRGVARVTFSVDGAAVDTLTTPPYHTSWLVPASAAPGSSLTVVAEAADGSGNIARDTRAVGVADVADTVPPAISLTVPPEIRRGQQLAIAADVTDAGGVWQVECVVDGVRVATLSVPPYRVDVPVAADRALGVPLRVVVRAIDFAGLTSEVSQDVRVLDGAPNRAPVAHAGGPYTAEVGAAVALSGVLSADADGDSLTFAWNLGDGSTGTGAVLQHTYTAPGTYIVTLSVADGRGGQDTDVSSVEVVAPIDRVPPTVTLAGPLEALPGTDVLVSAEASDNVAVTSVTFEVNGTSPTEVTAAPYTRTVTIPQIASPGARMVVRATARDAAANVGVAEWAITVVALPDTQKPVVTIATAEEASPGTQLRLAATATDNVGVALVRFLVNGSEVATRTLPPFEATYGVPADVPVGARLSIVAVARDFAGNENQAAATVTIVAVADTTPPAVALTAPAEAVAGASILLAAAATDNVGIASVAFFADGVRVAMLSAPPYQAAYRVPAALLVGHLLRVVAVGTDLSGLQTVAAADVRIVRAPSSQGLATGAVFDAGTSVPLEGAEVALVGADADGGTYAETTTTDSRGQFVVRAKPGQGTLRITKAGWTRVDRPVMLEVGQVTRVFDARLSRMVETPRLIEPVFGGSVSTEGATLTIPPGVLASAANLTVTIIPSQGLQGLLPPGWTPVAAVDVWPHGVAFGTGASLSARAAAAVEAGTPLVLAVWDEAAAAWRAVALLTAPAGSEDLTGTAAGSGQFAWLVADVQPAAPPTPKPGELLLGSAAGPGSLLDPVAAVVDPQPRVVFYKPGVRSAVRGGVTTAAPVASGTRATVTFSEVYSFRSGAELRLEPVREDLVLFQMPGSPTSLGANFDVAPSQAFDPLALDRGVITVALHTAEPEAAGFVIVGPAGGVAVASGGQRFEIPRDAVSAAIPVSIQPLSLASLGLTLPPPLESLDALLVSFVGNLDRTAVLSIPRPARVSSGDQILILKLVEVGSATRWLLVAAGAVSGDRIVSTTTLGDVSDVLEGLRGSGRYVVARATSPIGFLTGTVLGVDAAPFAGGLVSSSTVPVVALSRAGGGYAIAAGMGETQVSVVDLQTSDAARGVATVSSPGQIERLDLRLTAEVPQVVTISPADGAENVLLSAPVIVTFSKPIDPASVSGAGAANIMLTDASGTPVAGVISLSSGNAVVTFRPAAALEANTGYTVTVRREIIDLAGRSLAADVVSHFSTLDTTPPPMPPAGSITAALPDSTGVTRITATQGTAGPRDAVSILNVTRGTTTPALVEPNGGFVALVPASLGDQLRVRIVDPGGNGIDVDIPRFEQINPDGSVSASVTAAGGRVEGPGGVAVDVPAGAFPDGGVVTIRWVPPAEFPIQLTDEQKTLFAIDGGVALDFGGATPATYLNVSIPAVGGEKPDDQWIVGQVVEVNGQRLLSAVDTARLKDGRITTSSPPCPGVTAAATYGFVKSIQPVGVNYAQVYAQGQMLAELKLFMLATAIPWVQFSQTVSQYVCYPVLTGRVTVSPNTVRIIVPGEQLRPIDRRIAVTNTTRDETRYFARDVVEFEFTVTGALTDVYRIELSGPDGVQVLDGMRGVRLTELPPDKVTMHLDPDRVTVRVTNIKVTNMTREIEEVFPIAPVPFEIVLAGGANDSYQVQAIPVAYLQLPRRAITDFLLQPSDVGGGNLVVRALPGTIDPSRAELDAAGIYGTPARTKVQLTSARGVDLTIPDAAITSGGFAVAFDADFDDTFTLTVFYDTRPPYSIELPRFRLTITDPATGRVIRVIEAQAPPRDQPLDLGVISDDTTVPFIVSGPSRVESFDPSGIISFSFSKQMNAQSVKDNLVVTDSSGNRVEGEIRVSNANRTVTFVPAAALRLDETYTLTFSGSDVSTQETGVTASGAGWMTDRSGNPLPTTRLTVRTFAPRLLWTATRPEPLKDIRFLRTAREIEPNKPPQPPHTTLYVTVGGGAGNVLAIDVTDLRQPPAIFENGALPTLLPATQQRLALLADVSFLTRDDPPRLVSGPLAISTAFNPNSSSLSFLRVTGGPAPALDYLGGKVLTTNPDLATGANRPGRTFAIGYAKGVAALKTDGGVAAYAAVEHVGVMAAAVEQHVPSRDANPIREGLYPGDFTDLAVYKNSLVAISRTERRLVVLDPTLAPIAERWMLYAPRRIRVVEDLRADVDGNGLITVDERFDLAVVGCDNAVMLVDLRDHRNPREIGIIQIPGVVRELDVDAERLRVFAGVDQATAAETGPAFYLLDISKPTRLDRIDFDGDGLDDRIIWRRSHPAGFNGLTLDPDRGVMYVTGASGLEIWAVYDHCCDLGVDLQARRTETKTGATRALLEKELAAEKIGIVQGLDRVVEKCLGGNLDEIRRIKLHESGSSACLWSPDKACGSNYQPGVSDHDISVFMPNEWFARSVANPDKKPGPPDDGRPAEILLASCVVNALSFPFTDPDTQKPKPVADTGFLFKDISFIPDPLSDWETMRYQLARTVPGESGDQDNDLALGRQLLAFKHLTEAYGVALQGTPGFKPAYGDVAVTEAQFEDKFRQFRSIGIYPAEGYEWAHLMEFLLTSSKAYVRIHGAADESSIFHDLFITQLHKAGKTGIRAALARMVASDAARALVLNVRRNRPAPGEMIPPGEENLLYFRENACFVFDPTKDPLLWRSGPCGSMEEYAAATAVRTLRLPPAEQIFSKQDVLDIVRFYKVKADLEHFSSDQEADAFVALVHRFVHRVKAETKNAYDRWLQEGDEGLDPDIVAPNPRDRKQERVLNLAFAQKRIGEVRVAKIPIAPHVFNRSYQNVSQVSLAMFVATPPETTAVPYCWQEGGSGRQICSVRLDLAAGEHLYPEYRLRSDGTFERDDRGKYVRLFTLQLDQFTLPGASGHVVFTVDLPERTVAEADRQNNFGGVFFHILDTTAPSPPVVVDPVKVPFPLSNPGLLEPDGACNRSPELRVRQAMIVDGELREGPVLLYQTQPAMLKLTVENPSAEAIHDVTVCTTLSGACYAVGTLGPNAAADQLVPFSSATPVVIDSVPTVYSREAEVLTGSPFRVMVNCGPLLTTWTPDPNPTQSEVMQGGTAYRHYFVVNPFTGAPIGGATLNVTVTGAGQATGTFVSDATGMVGRITGGGPEATFEPGVAIKGLTSGQQAFVTIDRINEAPMTCSGPVRYTVDVKPFTYDQSLKLGSELSAELDLQKVAELSFQKGGGLSFTFDVKNPQEPEYSNLRIKRSSTGLFKGALDYSVWKWSWGEPKSGPFLGIGHVKASAGVEWGQFDTHQFPSFPTPTAEDKLALVGFALATYYGADRVDKTPLPSIGEQVSAVVVNKVMGWLDDRLLGYKSRKVAQGWKLTFSGTANVDLLKADTGQTSFSPLTGRATVGAEASVAYTLGYTNRLSDTRVTGIEPSLGATGGLSLHAAIGASADTAKEQISRDPTLSEEEKKKRKAELEKQASRLQKVLTDQKTAGGITFAMVLDPDQDLAPTRLDVTFNNDKPYGWRVTSGKAENVTGDQKHLSRTYTLTDPQQMLEALRNIAEYHGILDDRYRQTVFRGAPPPRNIPAAADMLADRLMELVRLLLGNGDYVDRVESGSGQSKTYVFPGLPFLKCKLLYDTSVNSLLERGVFRGGRSFKIEDYNDVSVANASVLEFIWNAVVEPSLNEAGHVLAGKVPPSVKQAEPGGGGTVTSGASQLRASTDGDFQRVDGIAALQYAERAGPLAPSPYRPADVTGPADKPHYGLGGFYHIHGSGPLSGSQLTVSYAGDSTAGINEGSIRMYRFNDERGDWDPVPGAVLNLASKSVSASISDFGTYTLAPAMPAGDLTWSVVSASLGDPDDPASVTTLRLVSSTVIQNDGSAVPAGTIFHVVTALPNQVEWNPVPYGEILTPDVLPAVDGVQVRVNGSGQIELEIRLPGSATSVRLVAFSDIGTAMSDEIVVIR